MALPANYHTTPSTDKDKEIPDPVLRALRTDEEKPTTQQKTAITTPFQWASPEAQEAASDLVKREQDVATLELAIPRVVVSEPVAPSETRILARGNWMDDSGEIVLPAVPAFLGKLDTGGQRATRLDLANWLAS